MATPSPLPYITSLTYEPQTDCWLVGFAIQGKPYNARITDAAGLHVLGELLAGKLRIEGASHPTALVSLYREVTPLHAVQ